MSLVFHYCISEISQPAPPIRGKDYKAMSKEVDKVKAKSIFESIGRSSK